jgi:hypothetical protein
MPEVGRAVGEEVEVVEVVLGEVLEVLLEGVVGEELVRSEEETVDEVWGGGVDVGETVVLLFPGLVFDRARTASRD